MGLKTLFVNILNSGTVRSLPTAFELPIGAVYTYREKNVHYLRVQGGSVVISDRRVNIGALGQYIPDAYHYRGMTKSPSTHHEQHVEVCHAEINITNP